MTNSREMAEVAHEAGGDFLACGRKGRRNALPDITEVMAKEKCTVTEAKLRLEELRISVQRVGNVWSGMASKVKDLGDCGEPTTIPLGKWDNPEGKGHSESRVLENKQNKLSSPNLPMCL
ncbi:Hypp7924 [Branchiostoma lanceolatum]|uniref:Hypp7924 protein n=1 Tax=Branchiostoma lanceolatum TaxID=7740 RepID=A0A8K0EGC3_BRALA|nr:Hypp7924 [Branchiostoma lanceolatum]